MTRTVMCRKYQQPEAQTFLAEQREKFLSNTDYERPKGWTPEKK